jgi:hypothetical protein
MNRANSRALSLAFAFGALLGLAAILIGAGWTTFIKPESVWPQEAAAEYKAANDALHAARERRPQAGDATAAAAQARFDRINQKLEAARYAHDSWGTWIAGIGFGWTLLCGAGYFATRPRHE